MMYAAGELRESAAQLHELRSSDARNVEEPCVFLQKRLRRWSETRDAGEAAYWGNERSLANHQQL